MNMKNNKRTVVRAAAVLTALGVVGGVMAGMPDILLRPALAAPKPVNPDTVSTDKIRDLTTTLTVQEIDRAELRKIGGAFATSYSLKRVNVTYQYPNKARFEGRLLGAAVILIYNGNQKTYRTPIKSGTSDVTGQPGQKQTPMDVGLFTKDFLMTDYKPSFLKMEGGKPVFRLSQRNTDNGSHEIVTVNPKTSIIERRLSYNGDNKLVKEMRFKNPIQARPGIWVPTRLEIYNAEGKFGVAQSLDDIKVNLGVDSSLFATS